MFMLKRRFRKGPQALHVQPDSFSPSNFFQDYNKHGLIADRAFFHTLMAGDIRRDIDAVVRRNVEIKASVVRFLPEGRSTAVLPPTEESEAARKVVGIWI